MRKLRVVLFVVLIIVLAILLAVSCNGQGVTDSYGGLCISTYTFNGVFSATNTASIKKVSACVEPGIEAYLAL